MTILLAQEKKKQILGLTGPIYFLTLGLVNFVATVALSELRPLDYIILLLAALPILIRDKDFSIIFGFLAAIIALLGFLAGLSFNLNPEVKTPQVDFIMGYLLMGSMLIASVVMIYFNSGLSESHKAA